MYLWNRKEGIKRETEEKEDIENKQSRGRCKPYLINNYMKSITID